MSICLFEDFSISTLLPLTHVQADFDLRSGIFTSRERAKRFFPDEEICLFVRLGLVDAMRERSGLLVNEADNSWLFLNGRIALDEGLVGTLRQSRGKDVLLRSGNAVVAAVVHSDAFRATIQEWLTSGMLRKELAVFGAEEPAGSGAGEVNVEARFFTWPWDLIEFNSALLLEDAQTFPLGTVDEDASIHPSVILVAEERIHIGPGARIAAGVVLDATEGPIVIAQDAVVMPQAVILGPSFVGTGSRIKAGAKIHEGCSIGPMCKIGGEVEASIFHSFANKQHDGFVGHSYLAPWTNLGADTNTSDLKNNYSTIRATLEGHEYDTRRMFLGTIMADHSKCGIITMFNTGTVAGVGCNIFGGDFPPKFLPSFSWGGADGLSEYDFDKCCETALRVYERRGITFTDAERSLLRDVFVQTASQRDAFQK